METTNFSAPVDLWIEAQEFLAEVTDTPAERTKKSLPAVPGLQIFLLYVRGNRRVPDHRVKGPITVQALIGDARMASEGSSFDLPEGNIITFAADVVHDVSAIRDSVLLVTHALPRERE